MPDLLACHWALGPGGGLTAINAVVPTGTDAPAVHVLIGVMQSWELADAVVTAHNKAHNKLEG